MNRRITIALVGLAVLCLPILVRPDIDPSPMRRIGDLGDEGYWLHNARMGVLFGDPLPDDLVYAWAGAPLFNLLASATMATSSVSFTAARMVSAASLVVIVVGVFLLYLPVCRSPTAALLPATLAATCHELLAWGRPAWPLALEAALMIGVLVCWDIGLRSGRHGWLFAAGALGPLALLAKLSAVYALAVVPAVIAATWIRDGRPGPRTTLPFALGLAAGGLVTGTTLLAVREELLLLVRAASSYNLAPDPQPLFLVKYMLSAAPGRLLMSTGTMLVSVLVGARLVSLVAAGCERGPKAAVRRMPRFEIAAWLWLAASIAVFTASGAWKIDRRTFVLMVPALVIAGTCFLPTTVSGGLAGSWRQHRTWGRAVLGTVVLAWAIASTRLLRIGVTMFDKRWLTGYGLGISAGWIWTAAAVSVAVILLVGLKSWRRALLGAAMACLAVNLSLDVVWLAASRSTVVEASQRLAEQVRPGEIMTGPYAHWLAVETLGRPMRFPESPRGDPVPAGLAGWNPKRLGYIDRTGEPIIVTTSREQRGSPRRYSRCVEAEGIPPRPTTGVAVFGLLPLPFSDHPRLVIAVRRLEPVASQSGVRPQEAP